MHMSFKEHVKSFGTGFAEGALATGGYFAGRLAGHDQALEGAGGGAAAGAMFDVVARRKMKKNGAAFKPRAAWAGRLTALAGGVALALKFGAAAAPQSAQQLPAVPPDTVTFTGHGTC